MLGMIESSGISDPVSRNHLHIAQTSANLLMFLSNDMLDYAQIEQGKLRLCYEEFNVHESCKELIDMMQFKASTKRISLLLKDSF